MSRTRIVFFGILAVFLVLIAAGLGAQILNGQALQQLFIAATIFAGGVVLLDMFGLLGHHTGEGDGADLAGDLAHGDVAHGDVGHGDVGHGDVGHGDVGDAGDGGAADGDGDQGDGGEATDADHGHHAPGNSHGAAGPLISVLTYLRLFVYFCLGFGPVGWVAMSGGRSPLASLALAAPVGVGAVFLAQAFFRFQRKDTDSQVSATELIAQDATVLVPLDSQRMGRVRVKIGMNVEDLFALAAEPGRQFAKGDTVRIARVTDECVYVR